MNRLWPVATLFLAACSQADGIDGTYYRVGQTAFEKSKGMSSALVLSNGAKVAVMKNSWGDTPLVLKKRGKQIFIQEDGMDMYQLEVSGKTAVLTDIDNPNQKYRFKKGD